MKLLTILLLLAASYNVNAQTKNRPPIKAKVDFIQKDGDSVTIYVKKKRGHNNSGYVYFSAKFPQPISDTIKIGKVIMLWPKNNSDSCDWVFREVKK